MTQFGFRTVGAAYSQSPVTALVGFGGFAFAGKDTAADLLGRDHGWSKTFMSEPLRDALLELNPLVPVAYDFERTADGIAKVFHYSRTSDTNDARQIVHVRYRDLYEEIGYDESKKNPEVRGLLQRLGTEVGRRMFGPNAWVDLVFSRISKLRSAGTSVAVTGIRFANELERVHADGGVSVWIERPGFRPANDHSSENSLSASDFDLTIVNDGTVEELAAKLAGTLATSSTPSLA